MQLDGKRFFYVNPLEVIPGISGKAVTHRHDLPVRPKWYACACCPPNVARTVTSIGKYAYGENETASFCHLYAAGNVVFENGFQVALTFDVEPTVSLPQYKGLEYKPGKTNATKKDIDTAINEILKKDAEMAIKEVMIEGLLSIQAGENPRVIEEKLKSFLSPKARKGVSDEGGDEVG